MEEKLKRLDKRYKSCKVLKWLFEILSIPFAIVPPVCVAFRVAPAIPKTSVWVGVTGFAAFLLAIGLLFVIRGLNRRYGQKLPWATTCTLGSWTMWAFVTAFEKIIEQAGQIALALALGSSVAFILSLGSECFRVMERNAEEEYKRLK